MSTDTTPSQAGAEQPRVAAIHHDGSTDIDTALADFAQAQRAAGRRVLGLVMQHRGGPEAACNAQMVLTDIANGDEYLVSQPMGSGSRACAADPQGFARASRVLRDAAAQQPELVICNRFGSLESEGGGFSAELLALLSQGTPVLTVVGTRHMAAWQHFVGDAPVLPPQPQAWADWFSALQPGRVQTA